MPEAPLLRREFSRRVDEGVDVFGQVTHGSFGFQATLRVSASGPQDHGSGQLTLPVTLEPGYKVRLGRKRGYSSNCVSRIEAQGEKFSLHQDHLARSKTN